MTDTTAALIVAAGRGIRAGAGIPKQFRPLRGVPILRRSIDAFLAHPRVDLVAVVVGEGDAMLYESAAPQNNRLAPPITGGEQRQASVRLGLDALMAAKPARVLIHDAVRPFVSPDLINRVIDGLSGARAILPALPVANTLKKVADGKVSGTVSRDGLYAAETPQGFDFAMIHDAHRKAAEAGLDFTDDAAVAEWAGETVTVVAGEPRNMKLTSPSDFAAAEDDLAARDVLAVGDVRVGTGYDVHAYGPGVAVMLGGFAVPHNRGVIGHSDADVVLHALTDAVLGALAEGDIGMHFPPSDPQWRGVSSDRFMAFAAQRVAARGGRIAHLDVVLIAEAPRIGPYRDEIRARIADICGIEPGRVAIKATSNEGLGFIGRSEGIAASAVATIRLPFGSAA